MPIFPDGQSNVFQMGVAAPLGNTKFRWGKELQGTLDADISTTGTVSFSIDPRAAVPGWDQTFRIGDQLLLGPSSHSDNAGSKEYVEIVTITNGNVTIPSPGTVNKYLSGDSIGGVGSNLAENWLPGDLTVQLNGIFDDV